VLRPSPWTWTEQLLLRARKGMMGRRLPRTCLLLVTLRSSQRLRMAWRSTPSPRLLQQRLPPLLAVGWMRRQRPQQHKQPARPPHVLQPRQQLQTSSGVRSRSGRPSASGSASSSGARMCT
jgi:hypothetical protein